MIAKYCQPVLITPEEAVQLSLRAGTLDSIHRAEPIFTQFRQAARKAEYGEQYAFLCALAAVYDAGRIQGIREERLKRASFLQAVKE